MVFWSSSLEDLIASCKAFEVRAKSSSSSLPLASSKRKSFESRETLHALLL